MEVNFNFRPLGISSSICVSEPEFIEPIKYNPINRHCLVENGDWLNYVKLYMASSVTAGATSNGADDDYSSDI